MARAPKDARSRVIDISDVAGFYPMPNASRTFQGRPPGAP
jgi:hypothetical protein